MEEKFYRKNDIGVKIEYYIIGYYISNNKKYRIYTDFVTDKTNMAGIRLFVDIDELNDGNYIQVGEEEARFIIDEFHTDIFNFTQQRG